MHISATRFRFPMLGIKKFAIFTFEIKPKYDIFLSKVPGEQNKREVLKAVGRSSQYGTLYLRGVLMVTFKTLTPKSSS